MGAQRVATVERVVLRCRTLPLLPRFEFNGEYVDRLVAEDPETERHFARYFGDLLSLKLRSRLRAPALVEDAKQETFARVLTSLKRKGGLAVPETLGAFVNSVCNNVLLEMYRSGSRTTAARRRLRQSRRRCRARIDDHGEEERARVRHALDTPAGQGTNAAPMGVFRRTGQDDVCRIDVERAYLRVLLHRAKARFRAGFMKAGLLSTDHLHA